MLHAHLVVHRLELDAIEIPVRHATLMAVARAESAEVDWEVVADCVRAADPALGRRRVEMLCITGANDRGQLVLGEFAGEAVVVRVVDRTVVLRGDGPLAGLGAEHLRG